MFGPLLTSLPKSESTGGDDGSAGTAASTAAAAATAATAGTSTSRTESEAGEMNVGGLTVTPVMAVGPNGTQQHILQVTPRPF